MNLINLYNLTSVSKIQENILQMKTCQLIAQEEPSETVHCCVFKTIAYCSQSRSFLFFTFKLSVDEGRNESE